MAFRTFVNANVLAVTALDFQKICDKQGFKMNDVLRDFIIKYVEDHKDLLSEGS